MADVSAELEAARRRYNELYPDRPIKAIGDTPDAYYFLVLFNGGWMNGIPLTAKEISAVEMITPAGAFS